MAHLSASPSRLTLHLSDRALTPILSSQQSQAQAQDLSTLTTTAIAAYDSASRLGLGIPQRIMIETHSSGPIILHSYISSQSVQRPQSRRMRASDSGRSREIVEHAREGLRPLTATTDPESAGDGGMSNGIIHGDDSANSEVESTAPSAPLLIASVVAPSAGDIGEARRAAARLERTGRDFQREWIRDQEQSLEGPTLPDVDDG